jgi:hypothetical protein
MPDLILPGDPAFSSSPAQSEQRAVFQGDLVGRVLALDVTRSKRFQCGGFSVNVHNPVGVVALAAYQPQIREALLTGILIDVSDQHSKGLTIGGTRQDSIQQEDTGRKAYITIDAAGAMSVMIPKNKTDQKKKEKDLAKNGILLPDDNATIGPQSEMAKSRIRAGEESQALEAFTKRFKGSQ